MAKNKIHYDRDEFEEIGNDLQNIIEGIKTVQQDADAIAKLDEMYTAGQALDTVRNLKKAANKYDDLLNHYSRMLTLLEETWNKIEDKDLELAHHLSE